MGMRLALFGTEKNETRERLQHLLENLTAKIDLEVLLSVEALSRRLRSPREGLEVAVLMCAGLDELSMLNSFSHLFSGMRLILILPDADPATLVEAHRLHPRYVESIAGNFEDLSAVIGRIVDSIVV